MQRMLISVDRDESRAAVVDNGRLTHLEIEPVSHDSVKGNIYRAVIARVEPSLQSAFVDFGRTKQGFLPVGEIHGHLRKASHDKRTPIQDIIKAGQEILVQVVRDEIGNKGATLSTYVSLPGRYLVLMPQSDKSGVSRKLSDSARQRVKELTESMNVPEGFGIIVRTSGETATKMQLTRDLVYLNRLWKHIDKECSNGKGPAPMYIERSLPIRFVRDYFTKDIDELVIDDETTCNEVGAYLKLLMPRTLKAVERYSGAMPLFARYGMLAQVESVFARQVPLQGGGSIVIDQTEALVAIDVNSGRVKGKDIEETALATNLEAAREIGRQLVLRDLGGLVVCDFIDMRDRKAVRDVEATMKAAMKKDKARHKIGRISEFGLLELSRQRLKAAVHRAAFVTCEHCSGTGKYRTVESLTSSIIRRIYELITQRPVRHVIAMVPPDAANFLLNQRRLELAAVENEYGIGIEIVPMEGMTPANVTLEHFEEAPARGGMEKMHQHRLLRVTQHLDLVRNKLMKREDHDIERKIRQSKAAAMIDWNEVYTDVEKQTVDVDDTEPPRDDRGRGRDDRGRNRGAQRDSAANNTDAASKVAAVAPHAPAPAQEYAPLPQPKSGLTGWIKSLFRFGEPAPAPAPEVIAPKQLATAPAKVEAAASGTDDEKQPRDDSRRGRGRRGRGEGRSREDGGRNRDGRGRNRDDSDRGSRGQSAAPKDVQEARGEAGEEGEERPKRRRRRRRRRGRGDDDAGDNETQDGKQKADRGERSDDERSRRGRGDAERGGRGRDDERSGDGEERPRGQRRRRGSRSNSKETAAAATSSDEGQAPEASETDQATTAGDATAAPVTTEPTVEAAAPSNGAVAGAEPPPPLPSAAQADEAAEQADDGLADVTSLARAEIERLRLAAGAPPALPVKSAATSVDASDCADGDADDSATDDDDDANAQSATVEATNAGDAADAADAADGSDTASAADTSDASTDAVDADADTVADATGDGDSTAEQNAAGDDSDAAGDDGEQAAALPPGRTPFVVDLRSNSGS